MVRLRNISPKQFQGIICKLIPIITLYWEVPEIAAYCSSDHAKIEPWI